MLDRLFPEHPGPFRAAAPFVAAVLSVAIGLGFLIHVPYLSFEPGGATDVLEKISSPDRTYPSKGKLLLTTVSESIGNLSVWELIRGFSDDDVELLPRGAFRQTCESDRESRVGDLASIAGSKLDAELAAFNALGLRPKKIPGGRVLGVFEGEPSFGKLKSGDVIVAVDGKPTPSSTAVSRALTKVRIREGRVIGYDRAVGQRVRIRVLRRGSIREYTIVAGSYGGCDPKRPVVGIALGEAYELPHEIDIDTGLIGGPSGGLVFTLSIIDSFTEQDLTMGHTIAVTGTIQYARPDGKGQLELCEPDPIDPECVPYVGEVGGVRQKVGAAARAGADLFIAPESEVEEMRSVAPEGMKIVGVRTLADALRVLRHLKSR